MADRDQKPDKGQPPRPSPPGEFTSDDLRDETARFLDELKKRRAEEKGDQGPKLGPPKRRD
jgi:hypothetical protein